MLLPMLLAVVDQTLLATETPVIAASLGGLTDFSWATAAQLLLSAAAMPLSGRLGDLHGRRNMPVVGCGCIYAGLVVAQFLGSLTAFVVGVVCPPSNTMRRFRFGSPQTTICKMSGPDNTCTMSSGAPENSFG